MYGNKGHIATRTPFPIAGNHTFVRAFVYIQANPDRWFSVLSARATDMGYSVTVVPNPYGTPGQYRFLWFHGTGEPAEKYAAQKAPVNRWACWEWEIRGATNEMTLSIDDKPVPSFTITQAMGWMAPAAAPLTFGYDSAHPEPNHPAGFDLWVDEIAVNSAKIGCAL
jgi:hypothetical protein